MQTFKKLQRWPLAVAVASLCAMSFAAVALAADLDSDASLSSNVVAPTEVKVGNNAFQIKIWATGNLDNVRTAHVVNAYSMATGGAISAGASTTAVEFQPRHYTNDCGGASPPKGCAGNPFEVSANLNVANGTPVGTTGTLTVAMTGDQQLTADKSPDQGHVRVVASDSTPPVIGHSVVGTLGDNGWYTSNVSLTWSVTENESPASLVKTGCVDQNVTANQASTSYSCSATSTGGSAGPVNVSIKRDATAPSIVRGTDSCSAPGSLGWCRGIQTAGFSASDAPSGLADATQASFTKTSATEGDTIQIASGAVKDNAGNTNPGIEAGPFKIDSTRPTISSSAVELIAGSPAYVADTWTKHDVRVSFACNDGGSGTTSALTGADVTTEGDNHSVPSQGACEDVAGNEASPASASFGPVKIDKTKPVITAHTGGYTSGTWSQTPVTVSFSCADTGAVQSGVAAGDNTVGGGGTQSSDTPAAGVNVGNSGTCADRAGNVADAESVTVKVDGTKPTISGSASPAANADGWNNTGVTVAFACNDLASGIATCGPTPQTLSGEGRNQSASATATDNAGNGDSATVPGINIDKTAPTAPNAVTDRFPEDAAGGWFKDSVTVLFSDNGDPNLASGQAGSGVKSVTPNPTFNSSGTHAYSGTAIDYADNTSAATAGDVKVDATKPNVELTCPSGPVKAGSAATASWTASDAHSQLDGAATGTVPLDTATFGTGKIASTTVADKVGLTETDTCTYDVLYDFAGFFRPVDATPTLNVVKAGSAVPVKFSLDGAPVSGSNTSGKGAETTVATARSAAMACNAEAPTDALSETTTAGSSSLTYDATADQWVYVWKTDKAWTGCRQLVVELADGSVKRANFKFTK